MPARVLRWLRHHPSACMHVCSNSFLCRTSISLQQTSINKSSIQPVSTLHDSLLLAAPTA